ncbi:Helix-turn-helix domain-containing protein [Streptomyces zhaozhouensis]|uniref:Helix-turn-helix domain-containing protein n=1 Tax=Streptomyces zhaozhouensis TaxID=1300267 RepID=A0A286E1U7_9ACTN|nr:helix-turn-helix transcriptional regulator [Streptomyces zhaozhouensis]SOD64864.1 Helix-turn-helix domain-containing protein [Streptomyces zhaozhouensis]
MIDRPGLADFLRRRRELLHPSDTGLVEGVRRRTPGLRREEVAQLANISTDYYARLEQRRGANPSEAIVASLARALRCDPDERDHLYHLAGFPAPPRYSDGYVRPGLMSLLDRLGDVPACVVSDLGEVLWQNTVAALTLGWSTGRRADRSANIVWRWFTEPGLRTRFPEEDRPRHSLAHVSDLRATAARRGGDADVAALVNGLLERSEEFRSLWERHEVAVRRFDRKRFLHPEVGVLHLTCEILLSPEADTRVLAFFPTEGTDAREKLALLRTIGTQDFQPAR